MPVSKNRQNALVTMSESVVNCDKAQNKSAKRIKKSKTCRKVVEPEATVICSSVSLADEIPNKSLTTANIRVQADQAEVKSGDESNSAASGCRKKPSFEETLAKLFGPLAEPKIRPRRCWELDTHHALFGPDGQIMSSEKPRHYDIWCYDERLLRRKEATPQKDSHDYLFGDPIQLTRTSSQLLDVTYNRLFGDTEVSVNCESEMSKSDNDNIQHWEVFEPYRGMKSRRQKQLCDATDTHDELFPKQQPQTVRKPITNPTRFSRQTPKSIKDVIYRHIQPLKFLEADPPSKTGKAFRQSKSPSRNPLTGAGYTVPSLESIAAPHRGRQLKAAADGVTVQESDRNPITGERMPSTSEILPEDYQRGPSHTEGMFVSHIVLAEGIGLTPTQNAASSDAHINNFYTPRNPITGNGVELNAESPAPPVVERATGHRRRGAKRYVPPPYKTGRQVLVWGKGNGKQVLNTCYIEDTPLLRQCPYHEQTSPITQDEVAQAQSSDADEAAKEPRSATAPPSGQNLEEDVSDEEEDDDDDDDDDNYDDDDDVCDDTETDDPDISVRCRRSS